MTEQSDSEGRPVEDRFERGLAAFYSHLNTEIATLREGEFRTGFLALALDAALIATLSQDRIVQELSPLLRWSVTVLSSAIVVVLAFYLLALHSFLTQHRSMRRRVERYFGFDESGRLDGEPLLPAAWQRKRTVRFSFQAVEVVLPLLLLMTAVHALTIYLVWRL